MKKLLIVNSVANTTSTGRIAEQIGQTASSRGYECFFAYGRYANKSSCNLIKIGNSFDVYSHAIQSHVLDNHGFGSQRATRIFIKEVERIQPDIVNLHNLHGYYINVKQLFDYLSSTEIPVVWTFHDCWAFTGHCTHFVRFNCEKWKTGCFNCPNYKGYPSSIIFDCSKRNYQKKKESFCSLKNLTIVTPSNWLKALAEESFLNKYPVKMIHNGIDLETFKPVENPEQIRAKYGLQDSKIIIDVASAWAKGKGMADFIELRKQLGPDYKIVLVGLNDKMISGLPDGIVGIKRTEDVSELASLYSMADVFVNPTYVDNFPTTNIEALACGTPVVTYKTGGSPEAIDDKTGVVVEKGDVSGIKQAIDLIMNSGFDYKSLCRERAVLNFRNTDRFSDYVDLFDGLTSK